MILTDPDGQPLTAEDLALLDDHPNLARLVIKTCKMRADPPEIQRLNTLAWAVRLLCPPVPFPPSSLKGHPSRMSFDLLGQLFGKTRRRNAEDAARHESQKWLDAGKEALVSVAVQALNAIPDATTASQLHLTAEALLASALTSSASAYVPAAARPALSAALTHALGGVAVPDPFQAGSLITFQIAAKAAVAQAIRGLTL